MPLYPCKCNECGHYDEVILPVSRYKELPFHCGEQMQRVITPLYVIEDMKPYKSPLDGSMITTRTQHREHIKRHGVVEVGNEKLPERKPVEPSSAVDDIKQAMYQHGAL